MRVIHLDLGREYRGGQRQVLLLHRELRARGLDSVVAAPRGAPLLEHCAELDLPAAAVPRSLPGALLSFRLWRLLAGTRILHSHESRAASVAACVRALRPDLRWVCHRRVAYPGGGRRLGRLKYRRADRFVLVAEHLRAGLVARGLVSPPHAVIPSAIDLETIRIQAAAVAPAPEGGGLGAPRLGAVGALVPQKGFRGLVQALPVLLEAHPGCRLSIIGEGPQRRELAELARDLGCDHALELVGRRHDVGAFLAGLTVLVAPSVHGEGSPAVVKEALAVGVPVVASELAAHREVLGEAACYCAVGDAGALAAAVLRCADDLELRRRLRSDGRRRVERFAPRAMAEATLALYVALQEDA